KYQREKKSVSFPQRKCQYAVHIDPFEGSFVVGGQGSSGKGVNAKNKAKPVFAALAEARPGDGTGELDRLAFDPGFLADFAFQASNDGFVRLEFSAEAVVFAEVGVIGPRITVNHQHLPPVRRKDVAQSREYGSVNGHRISPQRGSPLRGGKERTKATK